MNMNKETYERLLMDVTEFDTEDVITTSGPGGDTPGPGPGGNTPPAFTSSNWEMPVGF